MRSPRIVNCISEEDYARAAAVTRAYVDWLGIDLGYQDIEREMADFAGMYGPPDGAYLLAISDDEVAGGVGLRPLQGGICEMKRLFVYPRFNRRGIGRNLADAVVEVARARGYRRMRLDTLERLTAAQRLYQSMGFIDIPPYRYNPDPTTRFMELELESGQRSKPA